MSKQNPQIDIKRELEHLSNFRDFKVVKSNELIQESRFNMTVAEQKMIAYICSLIKPKKENATSILDDYELHYTINIKHYCRICGLNEDSGKNYNKIKTTLKGLVDKSIWIKNSTTGTEITVRWLSRVICNRQSGIVEVELDPFMIPYLFNLKEKFISYGLYNILVMQSQYSVRLYEIFKSYKYKRKIYYTIEGFKKVLMIDKSSSYEKFCNLNAKVINPAIKEINKYTDIIVEVNYKKDGKKCVALEFNIENKNTSDRISARLDVDTILDKSMEEVLKQENKSLTDEDFEKYISTYKNHISLNDYIEYINKYSSSLNIEDYITYIQNFTNKLSLDDYIDFIDVKQCYDNTIAIDEYIYYISNYKEVISLKQFIQYINQQK